MEFKGTKGPWRVERKDIETCDGEIIPLPNHFSCSGKRLESEVFSDHPYWHEAQENIKLIAAAPELLEALIELIDPLTGLCIDHVAHYIGNDKAYKIEQAIKKATK